MFRNDLKDITPIRLKEPLAEFLGAFTEDNPILEYSFIDTVKMAGHACPTVSAAFVCCKHALRTLYPDTIPIRGEISVAVHGESDEGVYGVMGQVFSFITGACPSTGFKGLYSSFKRKNLLRYEPLKNNSGALCFEFGRADNKSMCDAKIITNKFPSLGSREERLGELLEKNVWQGANKDEIREFRDLWMEKVRCIVSEERDIDNWLKIEKKEGRNGVHTHN